MEKPPDGELVSSARRYDVESKIFDGSATKSEVRDWYFSLDPLSDDYYNLIFDDSTLKPDQAVLINHNIEYSLSQIALFASAAKIISDDKIVVDKVYKPENLFLPNAYEIQNCMKYHEYSSFSIRRLRKQESIDELNIAQDCFSRANRYCVDMLRVLEGTEGNQQLQKSLIDLNYYYDGKSIDANKTVMSLGNGWILSGAEELKPEPSVLESIMYAEKQWLGTQFYRLGINKSFSSTHSAFSNTIDFIEEYIVNTTRKSGGKVVKDPVLKGHLHEILWLLDANFVLSNEYSKLGPSVVSAPLGYDRPEINHPNLKRGYDMVVVGHKARMPVQLKSSRASLRKHKYDERIYVAQETNFQDVDLRRLSSRLKDYRSWIESDFNDNSLADKIKSRLLPTVIDALQAFSELENDVQINDTVAHSLGRQGLTFLSNPYPIYKPKIR